MNWVDIIWSMSAATCLTLAGVHLLVWVRARDSWINLLFAFAAVAVAFISGFELALMHSQSTIQYGTIQRWMHVPFWVLHVSLVWFLRLSLQAGRNWLAWTVCGLRTLALILNFVSHPNLNFREITRLQQFPFLGETVSVPIGITNYWTLVGQLGSLLFLVFVVDASITTWRRGDHRRALGMGGTTSLGILLAPGQAALLVWGILPMPYFLSLIFLSLVLVMGYELSTDLLRATELSRQLRENEERMTLAANAAGLGMWEWNLVTDEIWATDTSRTRLGRAKTEQFTFSDFLQSVVPDDRESISHSLAKAMNQDGDYDCEYRIRLPDDRIRWIVARGRPHFDASGTPVRLLGVSLDITGRKVAEEAHRKSEELNRTILDSLQNHIAILDRNGLIIAVNQAWVSFARGNGLPAAPDGFGVGSRYPDACRPAAESGEETATRALQGIESVLAGRSPSFEMEYPCDSPSESRWFEMRVLPLRRAEGGVVTSHIEITSRKRAEQELQQKRDELAHLSRGAALGELSGSLAHELNQPLAAILHNAQAAQLVLAQEPFNRNEMREILDEIVEDDRRAGGIIQRLRQMLRKGEVQHQPVDANELVLEVLELLRNDLAVRSVILQTRLLPHLPRIQGDRVQLQQVLLNLIINSCHAMSGEETAERTLVVRTEQFAKEGVRVSVSDRGCGIAPENLSRIFEAFFTTRPEGMGMGLAVCRTIIDAHHGRLWAENNADRGATFHFTIPAAKGEGG